MRCATARLGATLLALVCLAGCDRQRTEGVDRTVEKQPVLKPADIRGEWSVAQGGSTSTGCGDTGAGDGFSPAIVRIGEKPSGGARSKQSGDVGGSSPSVSETGLEVVVCGDEACQEPLEALELDRRDGRWETTYGEARPVARREPANICRMRVTEWRLRSPSSSQSIPDDQPASELVLERRHRSGELILEGDSICRADDAVEMVERLDCRMTDRWQLARSD